MFNLQPIYHTLTHKHTQGTGREVSGQIRTHKTPLPFFQNYYFDLSHSILKQTKEHISYFHDHAITGETKRVGTKQKKMPNAFLVSFYF